MVENYRVYIGNWGVGPIVTQSGAEYYIQEFTRDYPTERLQVKKQLITQEWHELRQKVHGERYLKY